MFLLKFSGKRDSPKVSITQMSERSNQSAPHIRGKERTSKSGTRIRYPLKYWWRICPRERLFESNRVSVYQEHFELTISRLTILQVFIAASKWRFIWTVSFSVIAIELRFVSRFGFKYAEGEHVLYDFRLCKRVFSTFLWAVTDWNKCVEAKGSFLQ